MKLVVSTLALVLSVPPQLQAEESQGLPEPGPENGGLRMRLVVAPRQVAGKEGFDVRVDVINTSNRAMTLLAGWRDDDPGDVRAYLEAATSIECVPAVLPWSGGVRGIRRKLPQPEHLLPAGEVLSVRWRTLGRQLKNRVTDANEVQNPEFPFPGLYSVHAILDVLSRERVVTLRSNEQLVPVGGSRAMPRHTFGRLLEVDAGGKTAVLDLGARHKVEPGDRFQHFSKQAPWKLTITKVDPGHSWGKILMGSPNSEAPPRPGMGASLITNE